MRNFWISQSYLIPLAPFAAFAAIGLAGKRLRAAGAASIAVTAIAASWILAVGAAWTFFSSGSTAPIRAASWLWMSLPLGAGRTLPVQFGVRLDAPSLTLALLVSFVALLVQIYSLAYMRGERGYARFFAFLSLFSGAMLALVLAPNLLQIYFFWELVGLGSFLLIGFYYEKPSAVAACKKAFIVTRLADLGFLLGIMILGYAAGSLDLDGLAQAAPGLSAGRALTIGGLLLCIGAAGKSALFPLHVWLPDAMEGPTPVSALLHAATMVVAGVFLIARVFDTLSYAPVVLEAVAVVGALSALFAALVACTQTDFKRILAYSTLSQIGFMTLALGAASRNHPLGYSAALFHLTTHGFFKALLFLGAGAVIHATHRNNILEMGGLRKTMPWTHLTFAAACLAISGIPPFAGFFSKEEIFASLAASQQYGLFAAAAVVAFLTPCYIFRLYFTAFWGSPSEASKHAGDPPLAMRAPLVVLGVCSVVGGFLPFTQYVTFGTPQHAPVGAWWAQAVPLAAAVLGIALAACSYAVPSNLPATLVAALGAGYRFIAAKAYIDELYLFVTKRVIFACIAKPLEVFDRRCVDGSMDAIGAGAEIGGGALRLASTGRIHLHTLAAILGAALVSGVLWFLYLG